MLSVPLPPGEGFVWIAAEAALAKLSQRQHMFARASSYVALPHAIVGTDLIAMTLTK